MLNQTEVTTSPGVSGIYFVFTDVTEPKKEVHLKSLYSTEPTSSPFAKKYNFYFRNRFSDGYFGPLSQVQELYIGDCHPVSATNKNVYLRYEYYSYTNNIYYERIVGFDY